MIAFVVISIMRGEMQKLFLVFNTFLFVQHFWHCTHPHDNQAFLTILTRYMDVTNHEVFQTIWYFKSLDLSKKVQLTIWRSEIFLNIHWFWNQIHRTLKTIKRLHDSRKLNVCCGLMHDRILDWFFLQKEQLKVTVY